MWTAKSQQMKRLRSKSTLVLVGAVILMTVSIFTSSCSSSNSSANTVVTSFYPLEYVAREIAGEDFKVVNITPLGAEPHDLELTPNSTEQLLDAKLAIVMGEGFQPAIEKTAKSRDLPTLEILKEIDSRLSNRDSTNGDPHIWLDPNQMKSIVEIVTEKLIETNPKQTETYKKRQEKLSKRLVGLDSEYKAAFKECEIKTFVTSHDSFSHLARSYGLKQESIAGLSPENEPDANRLKEISKIVDKENIDVIFTEEVVSKKVAKVLAKESGVKTEILSPIEGLSEEQQKGDEDYFSLMETNLKRLSSALRCVPTV